MSASLVPGLVVSTNHRAILDTALFRRFDLVLTYRLPEAGEVSPVIRGRLGSMVKGLSWATVKEAAAGLSQADLGGASKTAVKDALLRGVDHVTAADLVTALVERKAGGSA